MTCSGLTNRKQGRPSPLSHVRRRSRVSDGRLRRERAQQHPQVLRTSARPFLQNLTYTTSSKKSCRCPSGSRSGVSANGTAANIIRNVRTISTRPFAPCPGITTSNISRTGTQVSDTETTRRFPGVFEQIGPILPVWLSPTAHVYGVLDFQNIVLPDLRLRTVARDHPVPQKTGPWRKGPLRGMDLLPVNSRYSYTVMLIVLPSSGFAIAA